MAVAAPVSRFVFRWWWLGLAAVLAVHLVSARWHILHGAHNTDEGFYAIVTRSVARGEMPYRDFGFTQPPVVPYVNALPLRALGFGLFQQRALNGAWGLLALGLAAWCLARRTQPAFALGLVLLFSLTAPWMYFIHLGKTYAVTTVLAVLAAWTFLSAEGPRRNFLLGLLAALGVASRLSAAPYFGLLWLFALWPGRRLAARELGAAFGGAGLGLAVAVLPFVIAAREQLWFWSVDVHLRSLLNRSWTVTWPELLTLGPAIWLLTVVALAIAATRPRFLTRENGVITAALVALGFNLVPAGVYEEYGVPFLLPLALAAAIPVWELAALRPRLVFPLLAAAAIAVQVALPPALLGFTKPERRGTLSQWLPPRVPPYQPDLPKDLATARDLVAKNLPADAPFVGSNILLAAETGREVPAELRMGPFSWTGEMPPERAARLHLATRDQLDAWFNRRDVTVLAFFQRWDLNYGWSMPSFQHEPPAVREALLNRLERSHRLAFNNGDFFILIRRPPPRPFWR